MKKAKNIKEIKLIAFIFFIIGLMSCSSQNSNTSESKLVSIVDTANSHKVLTDLEIPIKRINIGNVSPNKNVTGSYNIINKGTQDLIIEYVNPDCTCTGFTLSKKQIPPGDSATLVLNMSTKDKEGEVAVHATISANTTTRLYQVSLIANVL